MATRTVGLQNVTDAGSRTVLQYDATEDRFKLVSVDDVLEKASEDGDISDVFVEQVEQEVSVENVQLINLDGGDF